MGVGGELLTKYRIRDTILIYLFTYILIFMVKLLHSTSRGQITLPKEWRDNFGTNYYQAEIMEDKLVIVPVKPPKSFNDAVEDSWDEYQAGKFVDHEDLKKKYGL